MAEDDAVVAPRPADKLNLALPAGWELRRPVTRPRVLRALAELLQSERQMPAQLAAYQQRRLRKLLAHASASVPFYRKWLAGIDGDQVVAVSGLPILDRVAVQGAGERLHSTAVPKAHGETYPLSTSGSTGRAVQLLGTAYMQRLWNAYTLREHHWHGRNLRGRLAVIRWFDGQVAMDADASPQLSWGRPAADLFHTGSSVVLNIRHPTAVQVEWLLRHRPDYLLTHPSQLKALAEHCLRHEVQVSGLRGLRTIGESLSQSTRELAEAVFGAPVHDVYSCEEAGYLAIQCPEHGAYHVQSENVLLEIVDEAGRPCPVGVPGQVLITTLHNYATPLIRYALGDMAEWGEPCACGRILPVLRCIHGRMRNRLILPDGGSCFPYLGDREDYRAITTAIRKFQFVQTSVSEVELRLVLSEALSLEQESAMRALVRRNLGEHLAVKLVYLDDIPKSARGKYEEFISLVAG